MRCAEYRSSRVSFAKQNSNKELSGGFSHQGDVIEMQITCSNSFVHLHQHHEADSN